MRISNYSRLPFLLLLPPLTLPLALVPQPLLKGFLDEHHVGVDLHIQFLLVLVLPNLVQDFLFVLFDLFLLLGHTLSQLSRPFSVLDSLRFEEIYLRFELCLLVVVFSLGVGG